MTLSSAGRPAGARSARGSPGQAARGGGGGGLAARGRTATQQLQVDEAAGGVFAVMNNLAEPEEKGVRALEPSGVARTSAAVPIAGRSQSMLLLIGFCDVLMLVFVTRLARAFTAFCTAFALPLTASCSQAGPRKTVPPVHQLSSLKNLSANAAKAIKPSAVGWDSDDD